MAGKNASPRDRKIVRTSIIGIVTNLCLVTFKIIVGLMANSIAIVLDAMNNLSDALSSVITILGTKLAGKSPDKKHPFGYGRVEYLTAIIIAGLVLFAGVSFAITSVKKIITPDVTHYSMITVVIVCVAIVTKILLGTYTKKMGKETDSDALVASGSDATFDAVISAGTLLGAIIAMTTGRVIDGWVGAIISLVILKAGLEILMDSLSSIVGRRADSDLTMELKQQLCTIDGIEGAYDLVLHNYGPQRHMGSANVALYDWHTAADIHTITKKAQAYIMEKYGVYLYLGVYAINTKDDTTHALEMAVREEVKAYEYVMSIHAFFENSETNDVSFDAVIDFNCRDAEALAEQMEKDLAAKHEGHTFRIKIDRAYSD